MNKYKAKYCKQCKNKIVTFYKKDIKILQYANAINFQAFVKDALKNAMLQHEAHKENK